MTDLIGARLKRVCAAALDSSSYRMLWSTAIDELISPDAEAADATVSSEVWPEVSSRQNDAIPKIIFQTWFGHSMPRHYAYWRASFLRQNPTYTQVFWNERNNRLLIEEKFPWFMEIYDQLPKEILRSDVVRYFFLFAFGGFYADTDVECVRPLCGLRNAGDVLVGRMGEDTTFEHCIQNAMMASKPGQIFWLLTIALVMERFKRAVDLGTLDKARPEELTGPIALKAAVEYYNAHSPEQIAHRASTVLKHFGDSSYHYGRLVVLPPDVWYPLNWNNPAHQVFRRKLSRSGKVLGESSVRRRFASSYAVHYCGAAWKE
jgi:inositol phosphorylceramide mannosyltransferase catalytic subunit